MTVLLAQDAERLFAETLPWIGLLVILILLGGGVAIWLRKRMAVNGDDSSAGFILADLRRMRDQGEISSEEFESAKSKMIEGIKASTIRESDDSNDRKGLESGRIRPHSDGPTIPPQRLPSGD
ncbi:MAG: SHOCT domain-containing protein [Phycisphaerales bacterium]